MANGFEDAKNDRAKIRKELGEALEEFKTDINRLEHKVDNWMDHTADRIVVVERKLGINPGKKKVVE